MKRHLLILLLTALLGVGAVALCKYWNVLFPTGETSEIYRHYRKTPGIRAAYIQDMTVADTIHFDMTLLEARDSATYVWLLRDLGRDEEGIKVLMTISKNWDYQHRMTGEYTKDFPPQNRDTVERHYDIYSFLPQRFTIAIFHTQKPEDNLHIKGRNYFSEIPIK